MQGDKNAADQAAVDMMRKVLATVQMDGVVVIGEGEKDVRPIDASCTQILPCASCLATLCPFGCVLAGG